MQNETDATQGAPEGETVQPLATEQAPSPSAEQNPEVEGQTQPTSTEQEPSESEGDPPKRTPWFQRRIDELTREKWDERREKEALALRVKAYEQQAAPQPRGDDAQHQPDQRQPNVEELREQVRREEQARVQNERFTAECNSAYKAGSTEFSDFQQSVANLQMLGAMRPDVLTAVFEVADKDAHKVLYQLGKDPDEAERILSLSPVRRAVELAKLSGQAIKPPAVSKTPPPINRIASTGAQVETDPEKMSASEWKVWREKQLAQRA